MSEKVRDSESRTENIKCFIARDKDGSLHVFYDDNPPRRCCKFEYINNCLVLSKELNEWCGDSSKLSRLPEDWFPEITWDDEPVQLSIDIKKVIK